jgi:hypothetical protein
MLVDQDDGVRRPGVAGREVFRDRDRPAARGQVEQDLQRQAEQVRDQAGEPWPPWAKRRSGRSAMTSRRCWAVTA